MALPLKVDYSLPIYSLASPRTQIEMLESSFEDVFPTGKLFGPRQQLLDLSTNSLDSGVLEDLSSIGKAEMDIYPMTPDGWSIISNDANSISLNFKHLADKEINDDWDADDFDLRTSHCPWKTSLLNLPKLESSSSDVDEDNLIEFSNSKNIFNSGMLSSESLLNLTIMNSTSMLEIDDSATFAQLLKTSPLRNTSYTIAKGKDSPAAYDCHPLTAAELLKTPPKLMESYTFAAANNTLVFSKTDDPSVATKGNASYTISKGNDSFVIEKSNLSYTITKGNASYTVSTPPMEISPIPGSASKNSSFSEVAEKFHSLRRSMSSDSVMPLSQNKISGLSLTTRALVPTPPLQSVDATFSAAVADMRLRPGRAPLGPKGPMRAMLPLGQMMRAPAKEPPVEPAAKKQCREVSSPLPARKISPATIAPAVSTPVRKGIPSRRSISMSPIRRATPVRSPSSGYGQRRAVDAPVLQRRDSFTVQSDPAQRGLARNVDNVAEGAGRKASLPTALPTAPPTAPASRLKWPSTKAAVKPSSLPQPKAPAKGIPKPVLAVTDPNVRVSRLKAPLRMTQALPQTVKGKENRH